jgi:hypothetical protein
LSESTVVESTAAATTASCTVVKTSLSFVDEDMLNDYSIRPNCVSQARVKITNVYVAVYEVNG